MNRKKLALIHIVKKELGLSDVAYRAILREAAGVESAKDLTEAGFRSLLRRLVRSEHYVVGPGGLTLRQKLYLSHLAQALDWTDDHLRNFVHKYFHVDTVESLSRDGASRAITALEHILAGRG